MCRQLPSQIGLTQTVATIRRTDLDFLGLRQFPTISSPSFSSDQGLQCLDCSSHFLPLVIVGYPHWLPQVLLECLEHSFPAGVLEKLCGALFLCLDFLWGKHRGFPPCLGSQDSGRGAPSLPGSHALPRVLQRLCGALPPSFLGCYVRFSFPFKMLCRKPLP